MSIIKDIIKERKENPGLDILEDFIGILESNDWVEGLGVEEVEFCYKNDLLNPDDLDYVFMEGTDEVKILLVELGYNPGANGLEIAEDIGNADLFETIWKMQTDSDIDFKMYSYLFDSNKISLLEEVIDVNPACLKEAFENTLYYGGVYTSDEMILTVIRKYPKLNILALKFAIKCNEEELFSNIVEINPRISSSILEAAKKNGNEVILEIIEKKCELPQVSDYETIANQLFPNINPLMQVSIGQIISEDGLGLYTFLKTIKDMGVNYELEDIIDLDKNGEVNDKMSAEMSLEMRYTLIKSPLFNIIFRILETPSRILTFLTKNTDEEMYEKSSKLFVDLMNGDDSSGISKDKIIKIVEKRAKDFDLIRLHEDLERLTKFSYWNNDTE